MIWFFWFLIAAGFAAFITKQYLKEKGEDYELQGADIGAILLLSVFWPIGTIVLIIASVADGKISKKEEDK